MITYTTISYSDIYGGAKPSIEELLDGINSQIIIGVMAMVNSELVDERDVEEVQIRLTKFICEGFPPREAANVFQRIADFRRKVNGPVSIWGKRYTLEMMKNEFLNYRDIDKLTNTPEESVRIFKAYLLTADVLNERDHLELAAIQKQMGKNDPFFFEKMTWPFVLSQFDTNNRVNPISQFFRLCALLRYSITHDELLAAWREFIKLNGFATLRTYLGSVYFLIKVAQTRNPEKQLKVFSWINSDDIPAHLLNLSFDRHEFKENSAKQIDFLGLREKPLYQTKEKEFITLDLDFLQNKVYNGPLFDLFYSTGMKDKTQFKSFPDFKSHIATEVSEKIVFKGVLSKIFGKKFVQLHFDDEGKDNYPDCYIRYGKSVFLIEFKDYLFPGRLVEHPTFESIKDHIDQKFIKNERGKNKGISQILAQLKTLESGGFEFDQLNENSIIVYPIIIHTNFTYQMPGVNSYLNQEFQARLEEWQQNKLRVRPVVMLDMDTLFEFLQVDGMDTNMFAELIDRYHHILDNRLRHFQKNVHQDNFVRSRASFDEIYSTLISPRLKLLPIKLRTTRFLDSIGTTDEMFDAF